MTDLATGGGGEGESYTAIVGRVGAQVRGVEVHPRRSPDVTEGATEGGALPGSVSATVANGHFAAWWPGLADEFELTLHLADGSVISHVPAFADDRTPSR